MIAFSDNRRKIKLINHPDILGQSMSEVIREEFPRRLISASWGEESDYYKIEVSRWDSESAFSTSSRRIVTNSFSFLKV